MDAVVVHYSVGKGEVIWWASSDPLSNRGLKRDSSLKLLLASTGDPKNLVLFDEYIHGDRQDLWETAAGTPVTALGWQLAVVAVLLVLSFGRRNGPLRATVQLPRSSPLEFAESMGDLYRKAGAVSVATDSAERRLLHFLETEGGVPRETLRSSPENIAAAVSQRFGYTAPGLAFDLDAAQQAESNRLSPRSALELVRRIDRHIANLAATMRRSNQYRPIQKRSMENRVTEEAPGQKQEQEQQQQPSRAVLNLFEKGRAELGKVISGQQEMIDQALLTLLCGGHALVEGVPGVAKTLTVKTLARFLSLDFRRVQGTPDMMPADILGTSVFSLKTNDFSFHRGPVFTQFLLADEINRMPPRTQAALLESMEERQVTMDGERHQLDEYFTVFATQNPLEFEGTYPLPEAQLDRFLLKIHVGYPTAQEERAVLEHHNARQQAATQLEDTPIDSISFAELAAARQEGESGSSRAGSLRLPAGGGSPHTRMAPPSRSAQARALPPACSSQPKAMRPGTDAITSSPTT